MLTNITRPSAVDVLRPFVVGDTFYADSTSTLAKRPVGSTNDVLTVTGGVPVWSSSISLTTLTVVDSGFSIVGSADATKRMVFEVDGQTANDTLTFNTGAQTDSRTLTVPVLTGDATLMVLSETQDVTGAKTFSNASGVTISAATGTTLRIDSTTSSTAIGNGAAVLNGGVSVAGESFFGSNITATQSVNGTAQILLRNTDAAGTSAQCNIQVANATSPTANMVIGAFGASRSGTQFGVNRANACFIYSSAASTSAFVIGHTGVASPVIFGTNNVEVARVTSNGSFSIGTGAVATTATNGFLYVTACAGTPTGVPTAITGRIPIVVDSTNNKLYFYSGGAWRDAGP